MFILISLISTNISSSFCRNIVINVATFLVLIVQMGKRKSWNCNHFKDLSSKAFRKRIVHFLLRSSALCRSSERSKLFNLLSKYRGIKKTLSVVRNAIDA